MHIRRRKQSSHLLQYLPGKLIGFFISQTEHILVYSSRFHGYPIRTARTAQFRISSQYRRRVSRQVNLRHYRNSLCSRITYHFPDFILRIESACLLTALSTPGSDFRQPGIFRNLDSPSLIVCQVPVEIVQTMYGKHIDKALHLLHREEVAADIQHSPAVLQLRKVLYRTGRPSITGILQSQRLQQPLTAIKQSGRIGSLNPHPVFFHFHLETFRWQVLGISQTDQSVFLSAGFHQRQPQTGTGRNF